MMLYNTKEMYQCSYTEVFTILMGFPLEDLKKIPLDEVQFFYENMDRSYEYNIDYSKPIMEQEMSDITKAILANLFRDYFASYEERQQIKQKEKEELDLLEQEKRRKYNPDDLFKDAKLKMEEMLNQDDELLPVEKKKENIMEKILNFVKGIFNKKTD